MRVRFFNTFEPVTTFYRDLLPYLASRGMEIEVYITGEGYRKGRGRLDQTLTHPNIKVIYLPTLNAGAKDRFHKACTMITYAVAAAIRSLFARPVDLNFFLTQPALFFNWGWVLRVLRGQPYVCLTMDIYPDVAVQDGLLSQQALVTRFLTWLSRQGIRQAAGVVAIGRDMRERLLGFGVAPERLHVILNWANENKVYPLPDYKNELRTEFGLSGVFVVLYSGNMGTAHYFSDILEVARRLSGRSQIRFVFIGEGARRKEIEALIKRAELKNVVLLPFQPQERLHESLNLADVHFISLRAGFEGLMVPSKTYGALLTARPVIFQGPETSEVARFIQEERCGSVVPLGDIELLERLILDYLEHPEKKCEQGRAAHHAVMRRASRATALAKYEQLILRSVQ